MTAFEQLSACQQEPLAKDPYDRWSAPDGGLIAEFFRTEGDFLVRFPGLADFLINAASLRVRCRPAPGTSEETLCNIYRNSIIPIIGNHLGALNLHGSAATVGGRALGFMGLSRRGKTTLAGAFARSGHPFLTEDLLSLERVGTRYRVKPQRPVLRVFPDSAVFLRGTIAAGEGGDEKQALAASDLLPFHTSAADLAGIYVLGPGEASDVVIEEMGRAEALTQILQHAFLLDVEDRPRLRSHFARLADLIGAVPCYHLDYPRAYEHLPNVVMAIVAHHNEGRIRDGT